MIKSWKKQEKDIATKFSGRVQPGSGNRNAPRLKGDVTSGTFLHEAKCTDKQQYIFKVSDFIKLATQALRISKLPLFHLRISGEDLVVLRLDDFFSLLRSVSDSSAESLVSELNKPRKTARQRAREKNEL
jgi:hypothetical protein